MARTTTIRAGIPALEVKPVEIQRAYGISPYRLRRLIDQDRLVRRWNRGPRIIWNDEAERLVRGAEEMKHGPGRVKRPGPQ